MPSEVERPFGPEEEPTAEHAFTTSAPEPPRPEPSTAPQGDEDSTRRQILRAIDDRPGIYLRDLARNLSLSVTTVRYHVDRLEDEGRIHSGRNARYRHLYPAGFDPMVAEVLNAMNEPPRNEVLELLVANPGARPSEIARALELAEGTIAHHIRVLEGRGLINVEHGPGGRRISLPEHVADVVKEPPGKPVAPARIDDTEPGTPTEF